MTPFDHVMIPTQGNSWFQTSPIEHEPDNFVTSVCVIYHRVTGFTNGKDIAVQLCSRFLTVLWLPKTEIQDRSGY